MSARTAANDRRALLLCGAFAAGVLALGALVALLAGPLALVVAAVVAALVIVVALSAGARIALRAVGARPAGPQDDPRYANVVEGLCLEASIPVPALYVIDAGVPNALAVGSGPGHASIAVTSGLLATLNRIELEGVLAHELALITSHAVRARTAAVVLGALPALLWSRHGGVPTGAAALLTLPLAPLLRLVGSDRAELEADQQGAYLTRYPPGLIRALTTIQAGEDGLPAGAAGVDHLWLVPPPAGRPAPRWLRPAAAHRPLAQRIEALREL
ncbi:MAG TPA: M48 family metalloprotease [Actinomycetes bacterium]|nr:M48 family metalloprotease [Actinomycetes bacterium]